MKIQRFFATTTRDALTQVREALGPDAIILSNRNIDNGVEILALHERDLNLTNEAPITSSNDVTNSATPQTVSLDNMSQTDINLIINEIRAMRGSMENKLHTLNWNNLQQKYPVKLEILGELLTIGFSASLARYLAENTPNDYDVEAGLKWSQDVLIRNLSVMKNENELLNQGGVYALVGPTGVGKTTTTAKLAARFVMRYGPSKLALITTDSYRIGAHEQLRIYGKILGVMVHSIHDESDLHIALEELKNKHTILIDTVGMSQRDQMVAEQLAMLSGTNSPIKRLLCLNTTSTIETLNEVVTAYRGTHLEGCILTKLDEAVTLSNAIDVILRQKVKLFYVGTGQRVPEDLEVPEPKKMVTRAFEHRQANSASRLKEHELPVFIAKEAVNLSPDLLNLHVS